MNYFVFDDIDTRDYSGIYVSFSDVDRTPKRAYDVVEIPARNGAFYIDKQRFEDVEHSYYVIALTKAIGSQFINDLTSKVGYHKLEDSFNTDEFYSAVFTSGADVEITPQRDRNIFKVTFTRKPQRWMTSGETEITATNNGTITNPTPFPSNPLLMLKGYGDVSFNGYTIHVENEVIGHVLLANSKTFSSNYTDIIFNKLSYETGDTITLADGTINWDARLINGYKFYTPAVTVTDSDTRFVSRVDIAGRLRAITNSEALTFTAGTSKTVTNTATASLRMSKDGQVSDMVVTCTQTITYTPNYSSTQSKIRIQYSLSFSSSGKLDYSFSTSSSKTGEITVESTQSLLGNPTYIDCDIGEAYKITSGVYVSLNSKITLGSRLPILASGNNTITFSNTFTSVKLKPRWWIV